MTRAPPRMLRIAPMRAESRCACIEKLSFLFLRHEYSLRLPTVEVFIRLLCFGSGESIVANHQKWRCQVSHFGENILEQEVKIICSFNLHSRLHRLSFLQCSLRSVSKIKLSLFLT